MQLELTLIITSFFFFLGNVSHNSILNFGVCPKNKKAKGKNSSLSIAIFINWYIYIYVGINMLGLGLLSEDAEWFEEGQIII